MEWRGERGGKEGGREGVRMGEGGRERAAWLSTALPAGAAWLSTLFAPSSCLHPRPQTEHAVHALARSCALLLGAGVLTRACLSGLQTASATYPVAACPAAAFCPSSGNW
jgi:hypothetical protein